MAKRISNHASDGGKARAKSLSAEERSAIARRAVEARWRKAGKLTVTKRATHNGVVELGGGEIQIPCCVLDDGTRLITQYGFFQAIGRSGKPAAGRGSSIEKVAPFLALNNLKPFVSQELVDSTKPVLFQVASGRRAYGYRADALPKVCEVYLKARDAGALLKSQEKFAVACDILTRGLAHVGIIALVDEATGFQADRARDALAKILEEFVAKELRRWVRAFDPEFYQEMFRLRGIRYDGSCKRPQYIGHITNDLVYSRLAPGVLQELRRKNPTVKKGKRRATHHQWLTEEVGNPSLKQHLHAVTAMMRASSTWDQFYGLLEKAFPPYKPMPLFEMMGAETGA